jgi:two-component system phosphate regulon sensor histidine kinase PhoR
MMLSLRQQSREFTSRFIDPNAKDMTIGFDSQDRSSAQADTKTLRSRLAKGMRRRLAWFLQMRERRHDAEAETPPAKPWPEPELDRMLQEASTDQPALSAHPETGWRSVVDAVPDPALALDALGNVVHHNAAVADLFPRIRIGQPMTNVIRSADLLNAIDQVQNSGIVAVVELLDRVPVQRRVSAIVTALNFSTAADADPVLLITLRDITDQEKLAQMRADFIAHASHEMRTPLASLRGFVETLQGPARNDPVARDRFLGIMATQAARMTQLIDDLLSLSRIEMHVHVAPRGIVDLNEVVHFVAQTLEPVARSASVVLDIDRLPGPAQVRGDREELVQVVQNLMQNAIKYGKSPGQVRVQIAREPSAQNGVKRLSITVIDDGPGIPPEHLPRLTERFYRVSAMASREKGGTGLGLAIVKNVVTRHRGELKITSTVGEGSTFKVIFDETIPGAAQQSFAP